MKYLYYPGCSLRGTAREYEESLFAVAPSLGVELEEIGDWGCCGASVAKAKSKQWAQFLITKNLARTQGVPTDILMPCSSCYANHLKVTRELKKDEDLKARCGIDSLPRIAHLLEVMAFDIGEEVVRQRTVRPLNGLRVLPYYGCLVARPFPLGGKESIENPRCMERLILATGAEPLLFPGKLDCCGGSILFSAQRVALRLAGSILEEAFRLSPDCIVVVCPLCHFMLDAKQRAVRKDSQKGFEIPVLYVTQLVGLAMGINPRILGLHRLITSPARLLSRLSRSV